MTLPSASMILRIDLYVPKVLPELNNFFYIYKGEHGMETCLLGLHSLTVFKTRIDSDSIC
jgi:hypothetical protein